MWKGHFACSAEIYGQERKMRSTRAIRIRDRKKIADRPDQFLSGRRLQDKSVSTSLTGGFDHLGRVVHAEHYDFGGRRDAAYLSGSFQAIHDGHGHVQNHRVGLKLLYLDHRIPAVFGLTADLEIRLLRQDHSQPRAHGFVIIR